MKKDALKSHLSLLLLCIAASGLSYSSSNAQSTNTELLAKLVILLGPDRAREFIHDLEQQHKKKETPQPVPSVPKPVTPQPQPTPKPTPPVQPPVIIQPPMAPEIPAEKPGITPTEKENFNGMTTRLQIYMTKVLDCLKDFLSKSNNEPYRTHVNCFKTQLQFIQTQLQNYPQAQTPAATPLFNALKKIAIALEKCEDLICKTLDREYSKTPVGALTLGSAMAQMQNPVNQQRAIINQQIGFLRNELRKAQAMEMLETINHLNTAINNTFTYGNDKNYNELLSALTHRLKK